jgi:hypothetical protein
MRHHDWGMSESREMLVRQWDFDSYARRLNLD